MGSITFRELSKLCAEGPLENFLPDFRVLFFAAGFGAPAPIFVDDGLDDGLDDELHIGISGTTFECTQMQIFAARNLYPRFRNRE